MTLTLLTGCASSEPEHPVTTFPAPPAGLRECFAKAFPEIPDRGLKTKDVVRIIANAKTLDRVKSACGAQAAIWIEEVVRLYGPK